MKKRLFLAICLIFVVFAAAACSAEIVYADPHVTGIAVSDFYNTDNYIAGDAIDLEGAKLLVTYSDGNTVTVDLTSDMLADYDMNVPETGKTVTVRYGGKTTQFTINVYDWNFSSVELASAPHKVRYVEGERIAADGASINVMYEGGKSIIVKVTEKMLETYDNTRIGAQNIYISYYGYRLFFEVFFEAKTVTDITVLREPYQNGVFVGYGELLDIAGMRLKLSYDNGLAPEVTATEIAESLQIYIDDSAVSTVMARVAYLPAGYPAAFTYEYGGNPIVSPGDFVTPKSDLASNLLLDNVVSKSYGRVMSVAGGSVTVSTVVEYSVTDTDVIEGEILLFGEYMGRYGANNVYAQGGGGIVTAVGDGKVTMQTVPTASFSINVKGRSYQSMEIETMPITNNYESGVDNIIQGDTLNLSTGRVRVLFDNGETELIGMDSALIKVVNSDDDLLRSEIPGLTFTSVDDVTGLGTGRYELKYDLQHGYGENSITVVVTVVDETGRNVYVQENRFVSLEAETNYTVSITASLTEGGETKISECVYYLATEGAGVRHSQLDITAAGRHKLLIIYGGVKANSISMTVNVIQRYPVRLTLIPETDNISSRVFYKGDRIPLTTLRYFITYNNGDVSADTGVTADMLGEGCTLECDTVTESKTVFFVIPGTDVQSATLTCQVRPAPIKSVTFEEEPTDTFLSAPASVSNPVNLSGGILKIYYENGTVDIVGDATGGVTLPELLGRTNGQRIALGYNPEDTSSLTVEEIYDEGKHYVGVLTYYDADGASASVEFKYYIIDTPINSIKVLVRQEYYKSVYIQCEDWDLSGISIMVTYVNGISQTRDTTLDMVYDSTTDVVGKNLPLKFKYLGKVDANTLKIDVEPRTESALSVKLKGKDVYYTTDRGLDLSGYRFSVAYNAGAPAEVVGITEFNGGRDRTGWWFEVFDVNGNQVQFRREGVKIIRLYHTTIADGADGRVYNVIYTEFEVTVSEKDIGIESVSYDEDGLGTYQNLPILSVTAHGWELFLHEYDANAGVLVPKYLTVHYSDGTLGYVEITADMLDYNKNDTTKGYRKVVVSYKGKQAVTQVRVLDAVLSGIEVERQPCVNFIAGSELTLDGGILKCVYSVTLQDGTKTEMYKYLYMDSEGVYGSGFNSNIDPALDRIRQEITLTFREKNTTYTVTVFNKQALGFKYQNTIFFYGNTKAASAAAQQLIPEFDLPSQSEILMWYVENRHFIAETDFAEYLINNPNVTSGDFMRVLTGDGYCYVHRSHLSASHFIEPAERGYEYYIVMEVAGNDYYKAENYCLQRFTIIPKVIEVRTVEATRNAYARHYGKNASYPDDVGAAVLYLYQNLDALVASYAGGVISKVELLSPNADGFEIAVYVTSAFEENNAGHRALRDAIFTAIEDELLKTRELRLTPGVFRTGLNIGPYNGVAPEFVSYRIAAGETLTRNGVLELISGRIELADYDYSVGSYRTSAGTLTHKNYNIDFISETFEVTAREITNCAYTGGTWNAGDRTLTMRAGGEPVVTVFHTVGARALGGDELTYYTSAAYEESGRLTELPTAAGTYYVKVASPESFTQGGIPVSLDFILVLN